MWPDNTPMLKMFSRKLNTQSQGLDIQIDERIMPLVITWRRNARRLTLRVEDERITVSAPPSVPEREIWDFVNSRKDWIKARLTALSEVYQSTVPSLLYHGQDLPVKITPDYSGHQYQLRHSDG